MGTLVCIYENKETYANKVMRYLIIFRRGSMEETLPSTNLGYHGAVYS